MTGSTRQFVKKVFTMTLALSMATCISLCGSASVLASPAESSAGRSGSTSSTQTDAASVSDTARDTVRIIDDALGSEDPDSANVITELDEDRNGYHQNDDFTGIDIPKDPSCGITLDTKEAGSITMGLPREVKGEEGELDNGTVVYGSNDSDVSVAVQAVTSSADEPCNAGGKQRTGASAGEKAGCVRSLIVIESPDAPKDYSFKFDLSKNQSLKSSKDGRLFVTENDEAIAEIQPAWAKDADGSMVESHFAVKGSTLVQHVSFDADTKFPVVADPAMSGYYYKKSSVKITNEYGGWKRTSSILNTGKTKGGTLSINESHTISGSVSGNIKGIVTIGTGASITTASSKSWSIGKNKRCYAECRAEFKVERGTRKKISMNSGKVVSTNSYTVKQPRGKYYREFRVHFL